MALRKKLNEWFRRYAVAEFIGLILTLIFSNISMMLFENIILSGFIATWADNLGFYGTIVFNDLKEREKRNKKLELSDYLKQFRNVILEFGPAEYLDSFVIRPSYLILFPHLISNYSLAIFIGTVLADVTYYIPTIISYEFRKKIFKDEM